MKMVLSMIIVTLFVFLNVADVFMEALRKERPHADGKQETRRKEETV